MEFRGTGLIERASELRRRLKLGAPSAPPAPEEQEEGITAEERREILASIDKVATRSGLTAGTGSTVITPLRKGFVFPLVVNVLAIVLTAGIVAVLAFVFRAQDQSLASGNAVVTSAEGKLIQEIKRDSDSKLQEKDKAIAEIQTRLSTIDKQRSELAATIEQRIAARETELRAALKLELDKERQRLTDLGLSEASIQAKLKVFEAQKTAEFNSQLAAFQKQAAADKAAEDAKLAQARDEYQRSISGLNDERKKLLDESRKREDQLRASLDTKAKELEGQSAAAKASATAAQAELSRLEDQRSRVQAVEDRILGLYGSIRSALRERRFTDALASVSSLNAYLNDPSVISVPAIQARREADLFVGDALGSLAQGEIEKASVDSSKLVRQAELMAAAREASAAGDRALKAGDLSTAAAKYQESLATVPEILAAHEYFLTKAKQDDEARKAKLDSSLAAADLAFKAGDMAAASARYSEAVSWLPMDEANRSVMLARLAQAGALEADKARRAADTRAARAAMAAAKQDLASSAWASALTGYVGVLSSYPSADQTGEALKGIDSARKAMDRDIETRTAAYEKAIGDLKSDAGGTAVKLGEENRQLSANLDAANQGKAVAEGKLADSERRLKASQDQIAALQVQLVAAQAATAKAGVQAGSISPQDATLATGDAKALAELKAVTGALKSQYASYIATENATAGKTGDAVLIERQKRLVALFGSGEFKTVFPELERLVDSQMTAWQQQMSVATLRTAADIAIQATKAKPGKERQNSLDANAKHYAGDPTLVGFIDALRGLLK